MTPIQAIALGAIVLTSPLPAQAILLEETPERVVFMGYPAADQDLTVKLIRRKESFGLYAFRSPHGSERTLSREGFVGLVEGSMRGVGLDSRAAAFLTGFMTRRGPHPLIRPVKLGDYFRYRFEEEGWILQLTMRQLYEPTVANPLPSGIVSQLYATRQDAWRLEQLSRGVDVTQFNLRDRQDLIPLGH